MRILITWIVHIITVWWFREIQPYIRPPTSSLTFRLIPKYNHGPMVCLHILKTRKELNHREKEDMIMVTLVLKNHNSIRMTMDHR